MVRARATADYDGSINNVTFCSSNFKAPHSTAGDPSVGTMSFKQGDVLIITEQQSSGWWIADFNGHTAMVPSTFADFCPERL
jgi:hypothetical protein